MVELRLEDSDALDVGRVGDHGVGRGRAVQQVGAGERDVEAEALRVGAGDGEGVVADVGARDLEVVPLVLQRECDGAAAGADVDDAGAAGQVERGLDERLGLGPRHEHARVDLQVEVAKAARAGDVGDGLALDRAAAHRGLERADRGALDGRVAVDHQACAVDTQRVGEQDLGVEAGRVDARGGQGDHGRVEGLPDRRGGHYVAAACASRRIRFSSAVRPAVSSSSSPSRTASRLWTVSLMRWSVTRRSP